MAYGDIDENFRAKTSYKVFGRRAHTQYQAATAVPEPNLCVFLVKYSDFWGNVAVFGVKRGVN
jgi:hypothetical protein